MHGIPWWFELVLSPWVWLAAAVVAVAALAGLVWGIVRLLRRHHR